MNLNDGLLDVRDGTFNNGTPSLKIDANDAFGDPILRLRDGATSVGLTGAVVVGEAKHGALEVLSGASLTSGGGVIANQDGSLGFATIAGPGARWDVVGNAIEIGVGGTATLNVEGGGQLTSAGGRVAVDLTSITNVLVTGTGSAWISTDVISVASGAANPNTISVGIVSVTDGATITATTLQVGDRGSLRGDSTVVADVVNGGEVDPGSPSGLEVGILTVDGNFAQTADGKLSIDIGGLLPGTQHSQLVVTEDAMLDGLLDVLLTGGFVPTIGDMFDVLRTPMGTVIGKFANKPHPVLGKPFGYKIFYRPRDLPNVVILRVVPEPTILPLAAISGMCVLLRRRGAAV